MLASIIFLMLESLAMDSAAVISGWSTKQPVVPKKFKSIPRLELNAAVSSIKMTCLLKKELKLEEIKKWFCTDSRIVTGYIKNDSRVFRAFVADRVRKIRESTDVQ